jgi:hypothetical protein
VTKLVERVGIKEDTSFESCNFGIHFVVLDVRLEHRQIVHCSLAMGKSDDIGGVLPYFFRDSRPGSFDCCDRVRQSTILNNGEMSTTMRKRRGASFPSTISNRTASAWNVAGIVVQEMVEAREGRSDRKN